MQHKRNAFGFTIIELIVVVVILVVLATITTLAIGTWRSRTATTEVKHALQSAAASLKDYRSMNNGYPTGTPPSLPASYQPTTGVIVAYISGDVAHYCLRATSKTVSSVSLYLTQATTVPTTAVCS